MEYLPYGFTPQSWQGTRMDDESTFIYIKILFDNLKTAFLIKKQFILQLVYWNKNTIEKQKNLYWITFMCFSFIESGKNIVSNMYFASAFSRIHFSDKKR